MNMDFTQKERVSLWISRILGLVVCGLLIAFLLLYYFNNIDFNLFLVAMLGLSGMMFFISAKFLRIKSNRFWTYFSVVVAIGFILACAVVLIIFCVNGQFQI